MIPTADAAIRTEPSKVVSTERIETLASPFEVRCNLPDKSLLDRKFAARPLPPSYARIARPEVGLTAIEYFRSPCKIVFNTAFGNKQSVGIQFGSATPIFSAQNLETHPYGFKGTGVHTR